MEKIKPTVTVGITTCYGDPAILETIRSLRSSKGLAEFRIIIIADTVPMSGYIKKELLKYRVELIENSKPAGQCPKKKQIIEMTKSDLLIFTQDDVLFESTALSSIVQKFVTDSDVKFISIRKQPMAPTNFFDDITMVGTRISNRVSKIWNNGDNYLSSIGRCLALRTAWVKKFRIPDSVVSSDSYFYFENKRLGGKFAYLPNAVLYYKKPTTMSEHLRKSSRFQHQKNEMISYFGNISKFYKTPISILVRAVLAEWFDQPLKTPLYIFTYIYTRVFKHNKRTALNVIWTQDASTRLAKK